MSSLVKIYVLITLEIIVTMSKDLWLSPQSSEECGYNDPEIRLHTKFIGGAGGSPVYAIDQGRVYAITSWGVSREIPGYDYDAIANLQFESDTQYKFAVFGTDSVHSCTPFTLDVGDHIYGVRVIYKEFVHGLYFHTKNGLSYHCIADVSQYTSNELNDTGDIYVNNSYLSGFTMRTGGVIDAIDFDFSVCVYPTDKPTVNPTEDPTLEPTIQYGNSTYSVTNERKISYELLLLVILALLCVVIAIPICSCSYRWCYQRKYVYCVDKALVLIIGVKHILPGVESNVAQLISLWEDKFNYDVFVCLDTKKQGIIDFVDTQTEALSENICSYKAAIVHILSYATSEENFITSDSKTIERDFINHELTEATRDWNSETLVKIVFYDAYNVGNENICVDDNDKKMELKFNHNDTGVGYRCMGMRNNLNAKSQNIDPEHNNVTISSIAKNCSFTGRMCNVFGKYHPNTCSWQKPKYFKSLITELNKDIEMCTSKNMATLQKKVLFKKITKFSDILAI
eukprot:75517_1